jgi:hypothetical protein
MSGSSTQVASASDVAGRTAWNCVVYLTAAGLTQSSTLGAMAAGAQPVGPI